MANYIIDCLDEKEELRETYGEAMFFILSELEEEDLSEKHADRIDDVLKFIAELSGAVTERENGWEINFPWYPKQIYLALGRNRISGENYFKISTVIQGLPPSQILALYRCLLEWNEGDHLAGTKFYVNDRWIYIQDVKEIDSTDPPEIMNSIQIISEMANLYSKRIKNMFS